MFQDNHNAFIAEKQSASLHHTIPFPSPPSLTSIVLSIHHTDLLCLSKILKSQRGTEIQKREKKINFHNNSSLSNKVSQQL